MFIWLLAAALAQTPDVDVDADTDSDADAVIVVHGEAAIEQAREEVAASFVDLGWTPVRRGDTLVFRPPENWIGKATFLPDGRFEFSTPVIPIRGGDVSAAGVPSGDGMRDLPRDACQGMRASDDVTVRDTLMQLDGTSYEGPIDVTFAVYASQDSDTSLWSETQSVTLAQDQFAVQIGNLNPLDNIDYKQRDYWIGYTVSGEMERARKHLNRVIAVRSDEADTAPCSPSSGEFDPFAQQQPSAAAVASIGTNLAPSRERRYAKIREVLDASADEVAHYREVVQATAIQGRIQRLPEQLDALWTDGTPLYGSRRIRRIPDRRATILEHWATRADNIAGHLVCEAIEDWLRGVVIYGEHPITEAEYAEYEARRTDGRRLPRRE